MEGKMSEKNNLDKYTGILFELKIPKERGVNIPCRDGWNAQICH